MFRIAVAILFIVTLIFAGCTGDFEYQGKVTPEEREEVTLNPGCQKITLIAGGHGCMPGDIACGYGYVMGDIVLIDTEKEPELGDIVQFSDRINKSDFGAQGPGYYLVKIIGLPGDKVIFTECSYESNGYRGDGKCGSGWRHTKLVMWGTDRYDDAAGMTLVVPKSEYLADRWVGPEAILGEVDEAGSTASYSRFTIKQEAITGVILEKIGHDKEFEEAQKGIMWGF